MDTRLQELRHWLEATLGLSGYVMTAASEDASFRRYFRIEGAARPRIVMDAPPAQEDCAPFVRIAGLLADAGLHVPEVLAQNLARGFLLLTDLGSRHYLEALAQDGDADRLYRAALDALVQMQSGVDPDAARLPGYDADLLRQEVELFRSWYLERHLGLSATDPRLQALDGCFEVLVSNALEQPRVFVHRDYHSRNLMVCDELPRGTPGVLDFQGALAGPLTYDLVSLLRDCYIAWPAQQIAQWIEYYLARARQRGLPVDVDEAQFRRWFDLTGAQRHLKAAGIFARLRHRDGKPGYLKDIPRTLGYVREVAAIYPELDGLHKLLVDLDDDT